MSILSILLSLKLGCHTLLWPRTSTPPTVRNYFTILTQVHFAFLTCTFTCLLGWLRITRQRAGIRLCRSPLQPQPNRRIRWQRRGAIVVLHDICVRNELVLLDDICVMNCIVINLFCLLWNILYLLVMKPVYFLPLLEAPRPREAAKIGSAKKPNNYIRRLTNEHIGPPVSHAPRTPPHYVRQPLGTDEYNTIYLTVTWNRRIYHYIRQYRWMGSNKFIRVTFVSIFVG
jgi:hypothetical protein